ncbi:centrosome-associated zinc finger protein CP190 [Drosophila obscura]|uniref:centrosome-associated zinc finger protein CP190 n=1 Tax=Drosophila obscura TaxID=7282 RepID=UPI001BB118ED|nr:centrosome-associated zinc finger protein CP190 [Drosophila obscura]XP_022209872.2 centrosome-associated zinc finger protein CP190 [Drosophila obscura]XP_022209874.2 centrosome-associated zinc finger protein CP190 [Drosophila obscura]
MGEVKSVKVDNWGVFFLQKLQNFFNKTDYCDLTLQFRDNSQLKVHRLVLSACTDYFNVLEQNCEIVDDALIMPNEFQADVVVPIVNFMYTGTLEFELKMYGKLLRTAKEMNMTVLLKLLEAHRRTMENVNRLQRPPSPKGIRRRTVGPAINSGTPQQRVTVPAQQSRVVSNTVVGAATGGTGTLRPNIQRATIGNTMIRTTTSIKQEPTSPFEQLRKGYNNNKRPAQTSILSPPSKKPSLEEVKEFAEQQRMRKQIAAEYGDNDPEYDGGMLYDDVHADDDDDDMPPQPSTSRQNQPTTPQKGTQTQLEHGTTTIILKQDSPSQTPTIIVKDSSNAKLNHTKIIAEVLRQYPHIVKGHKNIKLKIMPNNTPTSTPAEKAASPVKRAAPAVSATATSQSSTATGPTSPHKKLHVSFKTDKSTPLITSQQKAATTQQKPSSVSQSAVPAQTSAAAAAATTASSAATASAQKRRIDSKTMHTLISQGAENTTGPWLCLRCGVNGRPISIPSYRGFRRHLINTHKETIDPALCEHCGWRSGNNRELHFHMYTEHQIKSQLYTFAECALCDQTFLTKPDLEAHINEAHTDENKQQCIYCNKVFDQELQLYKHMKGYHKAQALEDGIIDETDEEYQGSQDEEEEEAEEEQEPEGKVRILSDISLPANSAIAAQRASAEQEAEEQQQEEEEELEQPQEVKFVGADGNEVELTDEQRKEILSQLNQQQAGAAAGGVVMVLSEPEAETVKQEGDAKSLAGTEEEYDDSQIYSELGAADSVESGKKSETGNSAADESKESVDNLEWAENLIAESEEQNSKEKQEKPRDDISEKLKELTGDWTEDENEDEMMEMEKPASTEIVAKQQPKKTEETQPVAEESNIVEEEEEDDIDLALKSMHKSHDDSTSKTSSAAEQPAAASGGGEDVVSVEEVPTTSTTTRHDEKMDVDTDTAEEDAPPAADAADTTETAIKIKREHEEDEEFIKEDATQADVPMTDAEIDSSSAIAADTEEHLVEAEEDQEHSETDNMRKELLDELIAQAESPEDEDKRSTPLEAIEAAAATTVATTDSTETDDDLVPATQLPANHPSQKEIIESEAEKPAENNNDGKTTVAVAVATAAAAASKEAAQVEEKPNSSVTGAEVTDKSAAASSVVEVEEAASADKVKSLISEWADDDEDEDENGVSAAAKAEL